MRTESPAASSLSVDLAGIALRNPVVLAAGTCGYLDEMADALDLSRVGGIVTKSITARPREGNKTWRVWPVAGGMLNAVGLANVGLEVFEREIGPRVKDAPTTVLGSVSGFSIEDYASVAGMMDGVDGMKGIELNLSCPNVHGGMEFGASAGAAGELVRAVDGVVKRLKMFVKLSPKTADIVGVARACVEAGADGLVIGNTFPAMAIDVETRKPVLSRGTGGLSGPAIHPIAVRLVHEVYTAFARDAGVPIVGVGGVTTWKEAAEFVLAGASAVEMGTALFADPRAPLRVVSGLEKWVRRQGCSRIGELVGRVVLEEHS
ncbi:MAG: dihydroorotate dehydrogenase [Phycisphaerales bacterium]